MIAFSIALWLGILTFLNEPTPRLNEFYPTVAELTDLKSAFLSSLGSVTDAEALVAGLAMGERDLLSDPAKEAMREVSLTHLVAVSGANLAIVMGAVWFLLGLLGTPRGFRFIGSGLALGSYMLLVGPEPSVIRAGTMAVAVLTAMALGRGSNPLHALGLAVSALLLVDQSLATNLGFALSVLATAGLLIGARPIAERLRIVPIPLALALGAGIAAQVFTLPVIVMIQPGFPLYGIIANLIVEPVLAPVTILGILAVILVPFSELGSNLLIQVAGLGTGWILSVAHFFANLPAARLHLVQGFIGEVLLWLVVVVLVISIVSEGEVRRYAVVGLSVVLLVTLVLSVADVVRHTAVMKNWEILACDVGQGDAVLLRSRGQVALVDVGKDPELISRCLKDAGVRQIDLLVLTHFDMDHVGGIEGLSDIAIGMAVLSPFEDDRPVVQVIHTFLENSGVSTKFGNAGARAALGDCEMKILGPRNPATAETSNDASLTTLFDCPEFQLLNLADSGEVAQGMLISSLLPQINAGKYRVVKVAHHGSADQNSELYEAFRASLAIYSVGVQNNYGHPTFRAIRITERFGAQTLRTDESGAISLRFDDGSEISTAGKLAA